MLEVKLHHQEIKIMDTSILGEQSQMGKILMSAERTILREIYLIILITKRIILILNFKVKFILNKIKYPQDLITYCGLPINKCKISKIMIVLYKSN